MKYPARFYAQALTSLLVEEGAHASEETAQNLIKLLKKNGDLTQLPEIVKLAERALVARDGGREVVIETARPIHNLKQKIHKLLKPHDLVQEEVNPALVAGLRITFDGESQVDASLKTQLDKLYAPHSTV